VGQYEYYREAVVGILFLLSAWSLGVMIDRVLSTARLAASAFSCSRSPARYAKANSRGHFHRRAHKKSHIAKVVARACSEFQSASSQVADMEVIEAAKRASIAPSPSCTRK